MILHLSIAGLQGIRKAAGARELIIRGTAGDRALSGQWTAVGGPECAGGGLSPVREVVCPRKPEVVCPRKPIGHMQMRTCCSLRPKWCLVSHRSTGLRLIAVAMVVMAAVVARSTIGLRTSAAQLVDVSSDATQNETVSIQSCRTTKIISGVSEMEHSLAPWLAMARAHAYSTSTRLRCSPETRS